MHFCAPKFPRAAALILCLASFFFLVPGLASAATVYPANNGFESPDQGGGYQYNPSAASWIFSGNRALLPMAVALIPSGQPKANKATLPLAPPDKPASWSLRGAALLNPWHCRQVRTMSRLCGKDGTVRTGPMKLPYPSAGRRFSMARRLRPPALRRFRRVMSPWRRGLINWFSADLPARATTPLLSITSG